MARITHPNPPTEGKFTDRLGNIEFRDGVAEVDLADKPNLHAAYIQHRYGIEYDVDDLFTAAPADVVGTKLEDLTIAALRDLADVEGIDIPADVTKKADIIAVIEAHPDTRVLADGE